MDSYAVFPESTARSCMCHRVTFWGETVLSAFHALSPHVERCWCRPLASEARILRLEKHAQDIVQP